jgi:hypothetical protein
MASAWWFGRNLGYTSDVCIYASLYYMGEGHVHNETSWQRRSRVVLRSPQPLLRPIVIPCAVEFDSARPESKQCNLLITYVPSSSVTDSGHKGAGRARGRWFSGHPRLPSGPHPRHWPAP